MEENEQAAQYPADPADETYLSHEQIRRHQILASEAAAKEQGHRERYNGVVSVWQDVLGFATNTTARAMFVGAEAMPFGTGPEENNDVRSTAIESLMGDDDAAILKIAHSKKSADDRMREIYERDNRVIAWDSVRWAGLLGVTDAAIRKATWWKTDRVSLLAKLQADDD